MGSSNSPTAFDVPLVNAVVASKGAFVSYSVASVMQPDNIIIANSKQHDLIVFIIYPLVIFHVAILLTQCNKPYSLLLLGETIGEVRTVR